MKFILLFYLYRFICSDYRQILEIAPPVENIPIDNNNNVHTKSSIACMAINLTFIRKSNGLCFEKDIEVDANYRRLLGWDVLCCYSTVAKVWVRERG
jgi:hypothetical protein